MAVAFARAFYGLSTMLGLIGLYIAGAAHDNRRGLCLGFVACCAWAAGRMNDP